MYTQRYAIAVMLVLLLLFGIRAAVGAELRLSTGVHFNSVSDDLTDETDGSELTLPVAIAYTRDALSLNLATAYSRAQVTQGDDLDVELNGVTDTLVAANYTLPTDAVQIVGSLIMNLPTGKERLNENEASATIGENSDLFEIQQFGEGFNVGASLSLIKQVGSVMLGANGMYVYKGRYDPTSDQPDDDLDPGDQLLGAGLLIWQATPALVVEALAAYSYFQPDHVNGEKDFQEGGTITIGSRVVYTREPWELTGNLQTTIPLKDKELQEGSLELETENSGNISTTALVGLTYAVSPNLTLEALGDVRFYRESNRQDADIGRPYSGQRLRYSAGPALTYMMNEHIAWSVLAQYVVLYEDADIYQTEDRTFQGVTVNLGLNYLF